MDLVFEIFSPTISSLVYYCHKGIIKSFEGICITLEGDITKKQRGAVIQCPPHPPPTYIELNISQREAFELFLAFDDSYQHTALSIESNVLLMSRCSLFNWLSIYNIWGYIFCARFALSFP